MMSVHIQMMQQEVSQSVPELDAQTDRLVLDNYLARNFSRNTDQKKVCRFPLYIRI